MPDLKVPEEPIIDEATRQAIIDLVESQIAKTIAQARQRKPLSASSATEAFLDLGLLLGAAVAPPGIGVVISSLGPVVKPLVVSAVEGAEARANTAAKLEERAAQADIDAEDHIEDAEALAETEEREFLEKWRIRIHLRRARFLRQKAARLRARAEAQAAEGVI